jgi:hypothetical protein
MANNSFSDAITIASSIADRPAYSSSMQEMGREEQERGQAVDRREADRSTSKRKQAEMMQSEAELIQEITQKRRQRMMQGRQERARQAGEASEGMRLAQMASEWSEGCIWCRAKGEEEEDKINGHEISECKGEEAEMVRAKIREVQSRIKWDKYSGCFGYGLPQSICKGWAEIGQTGAYGRQAGGVCKKGFVVRVTFALYGAWGSEAEEILREGMAARGLRFDTTARGQAALIGWLGRKVRWGGYESNEACRAMVQLEMVRDRSRGLGKEG